MDSRELLIIDDEPSIHPVLATYLHAQGYTVFSAQNGRDGLKILAERPSICLVLTDVRIPGMDGLAVLREIKQRDPATQVILMTAFSDTTLAVQALRLGADDYLEKPLHLEDLCQVLERSLQRHRLRDLSRRWRHILEHLPLGLIGCGADGRVESITPIARELLDCLPNDAVGRLLWDLPGLAAARALFPAGGGEPAPESVELETCDRSLVLQPVETAAMSDGAARFFVLTDVTEEKALQRELSLLSGDLETRVEERTHALRSELEFSQRLLDTAGVLIAVLDHDGKLVRLNKFAEGLSRFNRQEAERVFSSFVQHPESPLSRIFDPNSTEELSHLVAELPTRDGSKRMLSWSTRNLPLHAGKGARLIVGIDVTEQVQLEGKLKSYNVQLESMVESRSRELKQKNAQLIHTARLASLGEIAAGIAHEMKQPLNVISITADLIKLLQRNHTLTEELLYSNLDKIRRTVDRMATTINHLRGFTHIDSANFRSVRLEEAVDGALSILGEQIKLDGIDIVRRIPDRSLSIRGELNQVEQVLLNLMQNARDAMVDRVQQAEAAGDAADVPRLMTVATGAREDGQEVYIEVIDTGIGIDDESKQRIFEPFFTTKEADRGTGLGLSISMNIVESHGGAVELESSPGQGSTFRVIFPAELKADSSPTA